MSNSSPDFQLLNLEIEDHLAWLRLNQPPLHELTPELIDELSAAHRWLATNDDVWAVILGASGEKFFCNGLSPEAMLACDAAGREAIFDKLFAMMREMYAFPKIELAAINGHAMAGGAVLAILCDFRFMAGADSKARIGFSEVPVGLTMPAFLLEIIEGVVGPQHLVQIAMLGRAFRASEALAMGLVDETPPLAELETRAETYLREIMDSLPLASVQNVKASIRTKRLAAVMAAAPSTVADLRPFITGNFDEGLRAVQERRKPQFQNP